MCGNLVGECKHNRDRMAHAKGRRRGCKARLTKLIRGQLRRFEEKADFPARGPFYLRYPCQPRRTRRAAVMAAVAPQIFRPPAEKTGTS